MPWSPEPSLCFHESCRTWPLAQSCSQPWGFAGAASALSESNTALTGKCLHQQTAIWMRSESHSRGIWCTSPCSKRAGRGLLGHPALSPAITGTMLYNPLHKQQQLWEKGLEWLRMLKVRCYRVLSQGDWEYVRNAGLCCSEEQHNILLMKLESHTSRETPRP